MASDLTIRLENSPGTIARVGEALGGADINIDGICGVATPSGADLHILVGDAERAREALQGAGLDVGDDRDVEVVSIVDVPGEMGRHLRRVAEAMVNVDLVYLATNTRLVLGSDDMEGLRKALHSH